MAPGYCKCIAIGNLTRDPDLRYIPDGTAVANFDVAINRPLKSTGEERREEVLFLRVTVWRKTAEVCGEHLSKGKKVLVEGYLKEEKWTTPEGVEKARIGLVADRVMFLSPKTQGGEQGHEQEPGEEVPF